VRIAVRLDIGEGASLSWLPQPTLIFDGGCLKRETTIALAPGGSLLMVEAVIFGRTEMGEDVTQGRISDACAVRVGERLIQADRFVCSGGVNTILDRSAVLAGCRAMATLRYVAADAEAQLPVVRGLLDGVGGMAGASAWDGLLVARFAAADGYALTRDLQHVLNGFRGGVLPRMWLF
jgi:urease accessory protein